MSTLNNNQKPSFTAAPTPTPTTQTKPIRPEVGAVWSRQAKTSNLNYMTIKLKITKEKLQELLNKSVNEKGEVDFNLVAFPNKTQHVSPGRPNFRIYEELNNPTN